jgi:calcineurin-like phosphoesterase family protein
MAHYVAADHHFGHTNIIEYCDRPFDSVEEMDATLLDRHYETVGDDDVLVHLGDVAMDMRDGRETIERVRQLDADVLVRGNHDVGLDRKDAPFPVVESCVLERDGYRFVCTHRPEAAAVTGAEWTVHGHHHDNRPEEYPFIAYDDRRVNVAVELTDYRPVELGSLTAMLDACVPGDRFETVADARTHLDARESAPDD